MTSQINGTFSEVDPLTGKYVLTTNDGSRYKIIGNGGILSLYKEIKELGRIVMDENGQSGCIWMEHLGVVNGPIGEYETIGDDYRVLPYALFTISGPWQENIHPLDYLIQRVLEKKNQE